VETLGAEVSILGVVLVVILILFLFGGLGGGTMPWGYGYGYGHGGIGIVWRYPDRRRRRPASNGQVIEENGYASKR
jgi:hypothetical protein